MREAEETIEKLLAGLRDAEPSAGMQRRIVEALEVHQAVASASPWRLRPVTAMGFAWVVAILICVIGLATKVQQPRHASPVLRSDATTANAGGTPRREIVAQATPDEPRRRASRKPSHRPGASAVGETQAASFPTPPLPLTEQERLLLRLAHRGNAENMAILNPDVRAAQSAKATEQFQQFFAMNASEMRSESE